MKICIISNFYPPFFFGGERAIQREAEGLAQRSHTVSVLTSSPNRKAYTEVINNVEIHRIVPFNLYPPYQFQSKPTLIKPLYYFLDIWNPLSSRIIKKTLQIIKPDVIYIHNFKGLSSMVFGAVKSLEIPSLFCVNDYSLVCPRSGLLRSSAKICLNPRLLCKVYAHSHKYLINRNQPGLVVSVAQFTLDRVKQSGFFAGIDTRKEVVGVEVNESIPGKDYKEIDILYVGGLSKHKGIQVLIKAFTKCKQENIRLHIVGSGPDSDEMEKLAGDDPRIMFHGFVSDDDLFSLRQRANIAVVPSIWYEMAQGLFVRVSVMEYRLSVAGSVASRNLLKMVIMDICLNQETRKV